MYTYSEIFGWIHWNRNKITETYTTTTKCSIEKRKNNNDNRKKTNCSHENETKHVLYNTNLIQTKFFFLHREKVSKDLEHSAGITYDKLDKHSQIQCTPGLFRSNSYSFPAPSLDPRSFFFCQQKNFFAAKIASNTLHSKRRLVALSTKPKIAAALQPK